jgi:hypothetical protein
MRLPRGETSEHASRRHGSNLNSKKTKGIRFWYGRRFGPLPVLPIGLS